MAFSAIAQFVNEEFRGIWVKKLREIISFRLTNLTDHQLKQAHRDTVNSIISVQTQYHTFSYCFAFLFDSIHITHISHTQPHTHTHTQPHTHITQPHTHTHTYHTTTHHTHTSHNHTHTHTQPHTHTTQPHTHTPHNHTHTSHNHTHTITHTHTHTPNHNKIKTWLTHFCVCVCVFAQELEKILRTSEEDLEVCKLTESLQRDLTLTFIRCSSLEKKIQGMTNLNHLIERVQNRHRMTTNSQHTHTHTHHRWAPMTRFLQAKHLVTWIKQSDLLAILLHPTSHQELIKRVPTVLRFLVTTYTHTSHTHTHTHTHAQAHIHTHHTHYTHAHEY